jgi:acyl-CoA synthetase (AMP-forming)/AMP-acid ligase II
MVAVLLSNRLEYPEVDVGLAMAGLVRVAINVRLSLDELSYIIADSQARVLVTEDLYDEDAAELVDRHGVHWIRMGSTKPPASARSYEDLLSSSSASSTMELLPDSAAAWVAYTSGTTGRPKGVVLSHRALVSVAFNLMSEMGPIAPGQSILLPQPLSHGAGMFAIPYLATGSRIHIMGRFDPEEAIDLGYRERISALKCVPTMLVDMLDLERPIPFESVIYGAAPIAPTEIDRALDQWGPVLMQLYGQSEAPVTITALHKDDHARPGPHRSSAGRPWRTVEVEILDPEGQPVGDGELGEVTVRGALVMDRYLGKPELTADVLRDGRVWTRDMGVRDESGYIYLRGRKDEMINSGGYNIAPKEVEDVVVRHPGVKECVALGVPHKRWGQAVEVYVVSSSDTPPTAEQIMEYCRDQLGFRRPRSVVFVDDFPRNAYGKVDRSIILAERDSRSATKDV